jgi:hypothetical protein
MIVLDPTPSVGDANAIHLNDICKTADREQDPARSALRPRALNPPDDMVQPRIRFGGIDASLSVHVLSHVRSPMFCCLGTRL